MFLACAHPTCQGEWDIICAMPVPDSAYIGIDVGGTFLKGARIDPTGKVLARLHEPIRKASSGELLGQLAGAVETLEKAGPAVAIGVGLPGIVEMTRGRVRSAPNVPALDGLKVGEELEARTGRASFAENDANAAALAEAWLGAGRGASHVLYVTLGTGVGGGLVFDGRIWMGRNGYAGEIGHIQVQPDGRPCGCGSWGCLETIAGVPGWTRRAEELLASGRSSTLAGRSPLDPQVIVEAARGEDAVALEIVDGAAAAIGVGVAAVLDLLNVDRVVVGGGVAAAGFFLLERIAEETRRRTFPHVFADVTFRLAELGSDAGVVGAARVGMIGVGNG
jgi:glucokinase